MGIYQLWTPLHERYLKMYFPYHPTYVLAKRLNRPLSSVSMKAYKLGLTKKVRSICINAWPELHNRYVRRYYAYGDTNVMAAKLNRHPHTVRARALDLGVRKVVISKRNNVKPNSVHEKDVPVISMQNPVVVAPFIKPMPLRKPYLLQHNHKRFPDDAFSVEVKALQGCEFELDKRLYFIQEVYYSNYRYVIQTDRRAFVKDKTQMQAFMSEIKLTKDVMLFECEFENISNIKAGETRCVLM